MEGAEIHGTEKQMSQIGLAVKHREVSVAAKKILLVLFFKHDVGNAFSAEGPLDLRRQLVEVQDFDHAEIALVVSDRLFAQTLDQILRVTGNNDRDWLLFLTADETQQGHQACHGATPLVDVTSEIDTFALDGVSRQLTGSVP